VETRVEKPLRADARRNRDALVTTATQAFATRGVETSLEDIAAEAGVGIGTLYRHFPTRDALIATVYRSALDRLCDGVNARLRTDPPDEVLADWMQRMIDHVATKKGLAVALKSASGSGDNSELFAYAHQRLRETVAAMLEAGAAAGVTRNDIDPADLLRVISGICMVSDQPGWREQAGRLAALVMDGLRYTAKPAAEPAARTATVPYSSTERPIHQTR
jgi:AcrR family transcriptional regulator